MKKTFRISFLLMILLISLFAFISCKEDDRPGNVYTMYTVKYIVNSNTYYTDYVFEGKPAKKPTDPVLEGYKFLYWSYGGFEYDFNDPVEEDINLYANLEECITLKVLEDIADSNIGSKTYSANLELISDSVNKTGGQIASGSEFSCYFYIHNTKTYDITFNFTLSSNVEVIDNLKFHLREVNGEQTGITYKPISNMENISITIPAGHRIMYAIDWKIELNSNTSVIIKELKASLIFSEFKRANE